MGGQVTAFFEERMIARGLPETVTRAVEEGYSDRLSDVRVFEDQSGRVVDLDIWDAGRSANGAAPAAAEPRGRGRPRLGVTAREVTLLPRQWDWLASQPGGASATIRRLIEAARKEAKGPAAARDAVYRFLTAMGGDRPYYEEALRALYRGETDRFRALIADWPEDVRRYVDELTGEGRGGT
jgi:hypothetical protein